MSTYDYYAINCNKLDKRLQEQNESNTKLKLELKAIRAQFKDISNYFKKESYRIKRLEIVIDWLTAIKIKTDIVLLLVKIPIDTSWHFVYILFSLANKS